MKFLNISLLLISLSLNLISGFLMKREDILEIEYDLKNVSEQCRTDLTKAVKCVNKISSKLESKMDDFEELNEKLDKYCDISRKDADASKCKEKLKDGRKEVCDIIDNDDCDDFLKDDYVANLITNSACVQDDDEGISILLKLALLKSGYLIGCSKSSKDDLCPLTKFVTGDGVDFMINNFKTIDKMIDADYEYESSNDFEAVLDAANDGLSLRSILKSINNILLDTCNDSKCNKQIIAIDKMILAAKAAYEKVQKTDLTKKYPKVFEFYDKCMADYRNGKCESISLKILGNSLASESNTIKRLTYEYVSGTNTVKKIGYTFVTMIGVSILLLL